MPLPTSEVRAPDTAHGHRFPGPVSPTTARRPSTVAVTTAKQDGHCTGPPATLIDAGGLRQPVLGASSDRRTRTPRPTSPTTATATARASGSRTSVASVAYCRKMPTP